MWHYTFLLYFWLLMWAPTYPQGPDNNFAPADGQTVSGNAQVQDPNVSNTAVGPNGVHTEYQGNSGSAPPNSGGK